MIATKTSILSIENSLTWSWGVNVPSYEKYWGEMVRMVRQPKVKVVHTCSECQTLNKVEVDPIKIGKSLTGHFDLCLVQNVCTLQLMEDVSNTVCRIGGMIVDNNTNPHRYDKKLAQCPAIITTNTQLHSIASEVNDNAVLIPNGLDLELFSPCPTQAVEERPFTVGFAGNIDNFGIHYKGYKYWVQAVLDLWGEVVGCKRLHGYNQLDREEMPAEFYHEIDCLVLPSLGEGCSNVTMEALACGVPVLTTPVGYHGEMLEHESSCLFIARDVENIKREILKLKNNPGLRLTLAENGRAFAEKYHDIETIADQYGHVFEHVLERINTHGR